MRSGLRRSLRFAGIGLAVLAAACAAFLAWSYVRSGRVREAPAPRLVIVRDSAAVARGRYLVHGPGHCADCHARPGTAAETEPPLSGGYVLPTFLGGIIAPNITPDRATGIGAVPDSLLARFFRSGINHRGRVGLPVMRYDSLSDGDLAAILAYLRSRPPVTHEVPQSRYNPLGWITLAWFLEPFPPGEPGPEGPPPEPTAAWGGYLAKSVATCAACHTARNMKTGDFTGPPFAGGLVFSKAGDPGQVLVSPNLTPDPRTGIMAGWTREQFIARFRAGPLRPWSPMPWAPFSRMTDLDLESLYLYLRGLEPIGRDNRTP